MTLKTSLLFAIAVLLVTFAVRVLKQSGWSFLKKSVAFAALLVIPVMLRQGDTETATLLLLVGAGLLIQSRDSAKRAKERMAKARDIDAPFSEWDVAA